jgi:hypothetical protein
MLAGLTENIIALLAFFKRMNVAIEEMIDENENAMRSIAEDAASGLELTDVDIEVTTRMPHMEHMLNLEVLRIFIAARK